QRSAAVLAAAKVHRRRVAQFFRGRTLRRAPAERGNGRLGGAEKKSALHPLFLAHDCRLWLVRSATRLEEVSGRRRCLCAGAVVQTHGSEPPAGLTAARLLAPGEVRGSSISTQVGAVVAGEAAPVIAQRNKFRRNHGRAAFSRCCGMGIYTAALRASGKCHRVLRCLPWEDSLARQAGRLLPPPVALLVLVRRRRSGSYLGCNHDCGVVLSPRSLPGDGLASLCHNADSSHRNYSGWPPSHGRPLRLRSVHRPFYHHRMGLKRRCHCGCYPSRGTRGGCALPDFGICGCHYPLSVVLAERREVVYAGEHRCWPTGPCN